MSDITFVCKIQTGVSTYLDISHYIEEKGIDWSRNDLDADGAGRSTLDGIMHRKRIGTKRKMSYTLRKLPGNLLAALDTALDSDTVTVIVQDLHGQRTMTMYCSSFSCKLYTAQNSEHGMWGDAKFSLIEV